MKTDKKKLECETCGKPLDEKTALSFEVKTLGAYAKEEIVVHYCCSQKCVDELKVFLLGED